MKLWIVRHGEAGPYQSNDRQRELTERGRQDIRDLALQLKQQGCMPDSIWVSPYLRTRQTFVILQQYAAFTTSAQTADALVPEAPVSGVLKLLDESCREILLVSHQPLVSSLVALLVDGNQRNAFAYPMLPGSVAQLTLDVLLPGSATLQQLQAPPYV